MKRLTLLTMLMTIVSVSQGQDEEKKRLDFARTYFELGGNLFQSFDGMGMVNDQLSEIKNPWSFMPYLNWGGFHFWGHAEFFVSFPLGQLLLADRESQFTYNHYVVTGGRYLPWAYETNKLRPYLGMSWSSVAYQQSTQVGNDAPEMVKEFLWIPDLGVLYGVQNFTFRAGITYYRNNQWHYPVSASRFELVSTPGVSFQLGLVYSFEQSHDKRSKVNDKWNSYSRFSRVGRGASEVGNFFLGVGPSSSFSLNSSQYNQQTFPFLSQQLTSSNYFDVAIGYQLNTVDMFMALSYRNPVFKTKGFGREQTIKKSSVSLELNKYIIDFSGFAPFIGVNVAYDQLRYTESENTDSRQLKFKGMEPGLSFGWDIIPGKTDEFLILRTNLRWYPFSSFKIDGMDFDFSQLEYNLIQVVLYPGRIKQFRS